eukprot:CAMPEP_0118949934 /NCGR_PEP_ID=MMETSP1169-20130426/50510_1 /TAXON_ID=36882 /ORGANISM="Pyramimonas obovata, Strain CCMP722" /LENGTH=88 /DNA_ID=CAMNT_0006896667 /DNA_START=257 /DNA_END=520 /DNA_ORIENTATION=+
MANSLTSVVAAALESRVLVCVLALICDALVPDYDRSTHLSSNSCTTESVQMPYSDTYVEPKICARLEGLVSWDSVWFLRIAQCGYEFE